MNEEDIRKEAEEISRELYHAKKEVKKSGPIWWILGFVLALLIITMAVPYYGVRLDPEPKNIPDFDSVVPQDIVLKENSSQEFKTLVNPLDSVIKQTANKVVTESCPSNKICYAKALYYFVRDNVQYVNDPVNSEYLEEPRELLVTKAGDCESGTILLASLIESVGIDAQIVLIPGHAFLRIKLDKARNKYKQPDGWIYLDWTCNSCEFGEVSYKNIDAFKSFIEV